MIAAIENAILEQLRTGGEDGVLGYRYATLETYPDDFDAYLKDKGQLRAPAAWAVFLGLAQGSRADDAVWQGEARFALVVAAQNLRNETATRHGDPADPAAPGSYQLGLDAIRLLAGNDLGLAMLRPIEITGMRQVARTPETRTQKLSLQAIELRCWITLQDFAPSGELGDFAQLHVDWDVPALGNVEPPLPAASPDAEDLIEVPQ